MSATAKTKVEPKAATATWAEAAAGVAAEVVRVLRGGSFEVGVPVPAEEESSEEDDVEDERRPTTRKVKYGLDGHDREWRYVA